MKKTFLMVAAAIAMTASAADVVPAPTYTEWQDQQVNEVNRFPVHTTFFAYKSICQFSEKTVQPEGSNYLISFI